MKDATDTSRTPFLVALVFGGIAVMIYLLCVVPCVDGLDKSRKELADLEFQLNGVQRDLRDSRNVEARLKGLEDAFRPYEEGLLKPLLGSWAMQAKALLDPLATGVGFTGMEYAELPPRALPLTKPMAKQLYARRPVRLTCFGGYAAAISFLMRVERDFPLVALESLRISAQREPDVQALEFVFEWPAEGASSVPEKLAKGKKGAKSKDKGKGGAK